MCKLQHLAGIHQSYSNLGIILNSLKHNCISICSVFNWFGPRVRSDWVNHLRNRFAGYGVNELGLSYVVWNDHNVLCTVWIPDQLASFCFFCFCLFFWNGKEKGTLPGNSQESVASTVYWPLHWRLHWQSQRNKPWISLKLNGKWNNVTHGGSFHKTCSWRHFRYVQRHHIFILFRHWLFFLSSKQRW